MTKSNRPKTPEWVLPLLASLTLLLCASARAETATLEDPTQVQAVVVDLDHPDQPFDTKAPSPQFVSPDGEKIWKMAKERALTKVQGRSGGIFDFNVVPDDFISATNFYNERFDPGETTENLTVVLSAAEARRNGKKLELTKMRMIYFISDTPSGKTKPGDPASPGAKAKPAKAKPKAGAPGKPGDKKDKKTADASEGPMSIPSGGRVVITAPKCEIDLETNEGFASGGASVEIFQKPEDGKPPKCSAKLFSPFLRWRSWNEAATGSTEIVMYTCSNNPDEADPEVWGTFLVPQPVGPDSDIKIRGKGMIFESGKYDRPTPVYDEEGRTAGTSLVARSKAYFHTQISTEMTASAITSLMPFQGDPNAAKDAAKKDAAKKDAANKVAPNKNDPKDDKKVAEKKPVKKKQPVEPEPYKTVVSCNGPAIFDMAYVPPKVSTVSADPEAKGDAVDLDLKPMFMGKRFEFLDKVNLIKTPVKEKPPEPGGVDMATHMSCGHLRIQYPPNAMPSMNSFPDYSEAIGGVKMFGYKEPDPPEPGMPPNPPEPFSIECERMYLDGPSDNMFLVAPEDATEEKGNLAFVKYTSGAAFAQQFCYRRKTQTLTMPSEGHKKMIIHPVAMGSAAGVKPPADAQPGTPTGTAPVPAAPAPGLMAGGDTYISWSGPLSRELRRIPVPHKRDILKEVLTLHTDVVIEQPDNGLKMYGELIRLHSDAVTKQPEYIYAQDNVDIYMGDLQARGFVVTIEMASDETGKETKNLITILGNRKLRVKADVFRGGGNAVRADKFIIDKLTDNFDAFGGAVAVVKSDTPPPPPSDQVKPPEAAQGATGLVSSIKFDTGSDIFIQCDGPFSQNAQTHVVTAEGNVLIRQTGLNLLSDRVKITLDDTPPPDPIAPKNPADPKDPKNAKPPAADDKTKLIGTGSNASAPRTPPAKPATPPAKVSPTTPYPPPAPASNDFFSSGLKSLECFGMVELATDDKLIHCDTLKFDAKNESSFLEMDDVEDDVRVYIHGEDGADKVLCSRKNLLLNQATGTFTPGGQLLILPYKMTAPTPRSRDKSPARTPAK